MSQIDKELIKKGNALMAAARDGKIGYTENHIRSLQNAYVMVQSGKLKVWLIAVIVAGVFGALMAIAGCAQSIAELPITTMKAEGAAQQDAFGWEMQNISGDDYDNGNNAAANGDNDDGTTGFVIGVILFFAANAECVALAKVKTKGKKYVSFANEEYPKLKGAA